MNPDQSKRSATPHCPACGHPDEGGIGAEYADELKAALREMVGTLRRIHVRVRVNAGVDPEWIEQQAKFMLDRWGETTESLHRPLDNA